MEAEVKGTCTSSRYVRSTSESHRALVQSTLVVINRRRRRRCRRRERDEIRSCRSSSSTIPRVQGQVG